MYAHNIVCVAGAVLFVFGMLACEEEQELTAPPSIQAQTVAVIPAGGQEATAMGTIPLPVNQDVRTTAPSPAFRVNQTGTGPSGIFQITNATNSLNALLGQTSGSGIGVRGVATSATGRAGVFETTTSTGNQDVLFAKSNGNGTAIHAVANGFGMAGKFEGVRNSGSNTLFVSALGTGSAISAVHLGPGPVGMFIKTSSTSEAAALLVQNAGRGAALDVRATGQGNGGRFQASGGSSAIHAFSTGLGEAASFAVANQNSTSTALVASTVGTGWAATFTGQEKGVLIGTARGTGLQVVGGTKQAVVGTTTGARSLYTEESSEVWFTDYGFGWVENGRARILIDPGFAQTINSDEPYHVFLEEYGDAQLYVAERTPLGFVVRSQGGPDIEFSYRIVARRRGFETTRLERAPWADNSPGFQTEMGTNPNSR